MSNRTFWHLMMAGSILGWLFIVFGIIFPFESGWIKIAWWCVLLGWGIGHPLEFAFSLPAARGRDLSLGSTRLPKPCFSGSRGGFR